MTTQFSSSLPIHISKIGSEPIQTVDARRLYATLGVSKDFSDWIKQQVERAGLETGIDFEVISPKGESNACSPRKGSKGGHNRLDYLLTLDAAKHIAMMSHTAKGKEVRRYFIEVERRWLKTQLEKHAPARVVPPLTAAQLGQIRRAVYDRAARHPQNPRSFEVKLYRAVAARYHVSTYKTLPSTLAADILEFIRTFPDESYLPISEAHGRRRYDAPLRELFTADSWRQIEWMKPNSVAVTARTLLNRHGAGPVAELLKRLRADGYDVSAGEAEISALYAIVGEMDVALNRIDAIVSSALSTGQTVKL